MHRRTRPWNRLLPSLIPLFIVIAQAQSADTNRGAFEGHGDIGAARHPGAADYSAAQDTYTVAGGGENTWSAADAFHFVWKKASGDVTLAADVAFVGTGGNAHRKACLIVRQSLDPDSAYADAVLHGDGLTCLQYRDRKGAMTHEIQSVVSAPKRLRIEKRGKYVSMSIAREGEPLRPAGGSVRLEFEEPFYIGLAVCAHDNRVVEQAVFSNVELSQGEAASSARPTLISALETISIPSKNRRVVYSTTNLIEAPNWSRDGWLLFNSRGRIWRIPAADGPPEAVDTGFANRCNNDHGISPDGTQLVISDQSQGGASLIYTLPITGGAPKRITTLGPSYWHGWSPDGKTLAYCAQRNGEYDIYTIPADGGEERRLTDAKGLDDGPDYSPDGRFIYFNSERSGTMQLWRMKTDGSQPEQVTNDNFNNWFPHPSPDGKWIVFLSYDKDVTGHPANRDVTLRLIPAAGGAPAVLTTLFGGQGTINVPSWSPDSGSVAFVSYQLAP